MSQDKKYTAADFERYHSGKMSEADMHAIEKSALADPFLADALEGYVYTNSPLKDIAELRERLLQQKKKKNVFLLSKQNTWLRIAAMFVLIAGTGYLAYQLNFTKENNSIAKKEDSVQNDTTQVVTQQTDSIPGNENIVAVTPNVKDKQTLVSKENKLPSPVQNASDKQIATTEFQHNEIQQKPTMTAPAKDYAVRDEKINDKKEVIADIKSDTLAEVAVTAYGTKQKRQLSRAPALQRKVPGIAVENASQPTGGWQKFNEYIKSNITSPVDAEDNMYKGKVILSFEINKRGNPKDIKVEQSLCKPCDEEAKRLLKQGPKWKYVNDKRQQVTIEF